MKKTVFSCLVLLFVNAGLAQAQESSSDAPAIGGALQSGWEVCNQSNEQSVNVSYVTYQHGEWVKKGWRVVERNTCSTLIDKISSRYVYYFAKGISRQWAGDKKFCADPNKVFSWAGSGVCPDGFELHSYVRVDTKEYDVYTTRLTGK